MLATLGWITLGIAVAVWSIVLLNRLSVDTAEGVVGERRTDLTVRSVIFLSWLYSVAPPLVGLMQLGRQGNKIGTPTTVTPLAAHLATGLSAAIALLCLRLLLDNAAGRASSTFGYLAAFLAPWLAIEAVGGAAAGYASARQMLLYPLVALAFWLACPSIRVISTLGVLTIITAGFSLMFALVSPLGLVNAGPAGTDKAIVGSGPNLLAGPYNHANSLGLSLALGLPSIAVLSSRRLRVAGVTMVALALLWTASRTSILAGAVVLLVYAATRRRTVRALRSVSAVSIVVGIALGVATPLLEQNPTAFSSRGAIWMASLSNWHRHLWFGSGPQFYERPNDLGFYALYGHNLMVDTLARGGLVALAALVIYFLSLTRRAMTLANLTSYPLLLLVAFVYVSWLEVPFDLNNLGILGYACWIPFAVLAFTRDAPNADLHARATTPAADQIATAA